MAIINQYKASYPIQNSLEKETIHINASSMANAISMLVTDKGSEPDFIGVTNKNVITEITSETFVSLTTKCYAVIDNVETELDNIHAYPIALSNLKRGLTTYITAPNYQDEENAYIFSNWVLPNGETSTESNLLITIPLDESVSNILYKAIYTITTPNI